MEPMSKETAESQLAASIGARRSRASLLKGALAGGVAVAGAGLLASSPLRARADVMASPDTIATILTVARTAEQLAVTFYSNGVANAAALGLSGLNLDDIKAALIEEQIHLNFFAANGGQSLASTFSFPQGAATFQNLQAFIATQQQLEGGFDSAFLAAIKEFCELGRPDLAQIAGQVACVESEHRALGRQIAGLDPANNWAFAPVLVASVGAAPAVFQQAGYLSPTTGNSYSYQPATFTDASNDALGLYAVAQNVLYQTPTAVSAPPTAQLPTLPSGYSG